MESLPTNKLGHEDALLKVMFEHATVGIVMANEAGVIIRCNPYAARMFGYEIDELVGQQIEILIPDKFRSKHLGHRKSYHKNPVPRYIGVGRELFAKRKDDKQFPVEVSLSYAQDGGQKIVIAIVNDITVRIEKETELVAKRTKELAESQVKLLNTQKVAQLGYIEYNLKTNVFQGSEQLYKIFDLDTKTPMTFERYNSYIHPDDIDSVRFKIAEAKEKDTLFVSEHRIITAKGNLKHIYTKTSNIIKDAEGNPIERRGIVQDITTLKTMEITLRENQVILEKALKKEQQLSELKSRFVSMASHEFRTPLTTILSSSRLVELHLERGNLDKYPKHLNNIQSAVKNLTSILNDFLSLEKLESGKVQFNPESVDLSEFVSAILEEINLLVADNQKINYIHSGDKEAHIDQYLVRNILINLLSNAVKYSPNGKDIDLHINRKKSSLVISVKDRGIGIPEDQHEQMFGRFFRADNATNIQGTGIGLTIVKRYLDIMNGSISFESQLGVGTTFIVEIPQ